MQVVGGNEAICSSTTIAFASLLLLAQLSYLPPLALWVWAQELHNFANRQRKCSCVARDVCVHRPGVALPRLVPPCAATHRTGSSGLLFQINTAVLYGTHCLLAPHYHVLATAA